MLNTEELEKRWLIYKIKSYIPRLVIGFSLILIPLSVFVLIPESPKETIENKPTIKKEIKVSKTFKKEKVKKTINEPIYTKHNNKKKRDQLSPSLNFMRTMQDSIQPYYREELPTQTSIINDTLPKKSKPIVIKVKETTTVQLEKKTYKKKQKISIKRKNTQNDINDIIKRFKKNNNPVLSLFVAKKYYELQNYTQAYNYALITNKIDKNIEASWIIFSKSLVKLHKRKIAIKVLIEYIKSSNSNTATILLDEIKSGRFK